MNRIEDDVLPIHMCILYHIQKCLIARQDATSAVSNGIDGAQNCDDVRVT